LAICIFRVVLPQTSACPPAAEDLRIATVAGSVDRQAENLEAMPELIEPDARLQPCGVHNVGEQERRVGLQGIPHPERGREAQLSVRQDVLERGFTICVIEEELTRSPERWGIGEVRGHNARRVDGLCPLASVGARFRIFSKVSEDGARLCVVLQGRPLLATAADARLFVDRDDELGQLERGVRRGFNVALYGTRGTGKSSLLHRLEYRERESRRVRYVDASAVQTVADLVGRIRDGVAGRPGFNRLLAEQVDLTMSSLRGTAPGAPSGELVDRLGWLREAEPTLVLVDASSAAAAAYQLFGRLRDELWQLDHRWVVAVDNDEWPQLQRPPADAFFDVHISLSPFEDAALTELLTRREPGLRRRDLVKITAESAGNPRRALELVRQALVTEQPLNDVLSHRAARESAAARLGRPHSMLLAELENSSEALSPSDEQLLARLSWTRERAGQVFRELATANLVVSTTQRQARGRPRTLYVPNDQYIGER
jgi:hypothetical protein